MGKQEVNVKIEKKEWEAALEKSFKKNVETVKIDGFRQGKAPRDIYEKKLGKESLYMDAIDFALPKAYEKALKQSNLQPIVQPEVDVKKIDEDGVEVVFTIVTKPEVEIKKYKNLGIKSEKINITEEEINKGVEELQQKYAEISLKEDAIVTGDTVVLDFLGKKDGVPFEGGKGENYPLEIGSNTFIPGFEDNLIGLKSGDSKDIEVTFPKDYPSEDLKGQKVIFEVKINEVKHKILPEINKDFFADLSIEGVDSEKTLREFVKNELTIEKEEKAKEAKVESILNKIIESLKIELPEEMVTEEIHFMIKQFEQNLSMQGLSLDQFMEMTKTTHEKFHEQYRGQAEKRILQSLVLNKIAELEKIDVTKEEIDIEIPALAARYNISEEEIKKLDGVEEALSGDIKIRKIINFLLE
ncbi:MAG: trigger factor, partial [Mollicutes bacterium]|nr:trigger factor [Mollicutes bacterium]